MKVYVCMCMHVYVCVCMCMYMYLYVCICMYACMHVCIQLYIYTYLYMLIAKVLCFILGESKIIQSTRGNPWVNQLNAEIVV